MPEPIKQATASCHMAAMQRYFTGSPATHAERFAGLWLCSTAVPPRRENKDKFGGVSAAAATVQSHGAAAVVVVVKFDSRCDVLYYAVMETVLRAAEWAWGRWYSRREVSLSGTCPPDASAKSIGTEGCAADSLEERASSRMHALSAWVRMWVKVWSVMKKRDESDEKASGAGVASSSADAELSTGDGLELVRRLGVRLQSGEPPLPRIHGIVYADKDDENRAKIVNRAHVAADEGEGVRLGKGTEGNKNGNKNGNDDDEAALQCAFEAARERFAACVGQCSDEMKLRGYGLFKQAMEGDVRTSAPWRIDVVARAKWEAWKEHAGMSRVAAQRAYVDMCATLM